MKKILSLFIVFLLVIFIIFLRFWISWNMYVGEECKYEKVSKEYKRIKWLTLSNSWNIAFIAEDIDGKFFIVRNWVEGKKYDFISNFIYSPNNKKNVFIATKKWKNNQYYIVENWIEFLIEKPEYIVNNYDIISVRYSEDNELLILLEGLVERNKSSLRTSYSLIIKDEQWLKMYNDVKFPTDGSGQNEFVLVNIEWKSINLNNPYYHYIPPKKIIKDISPNGNNSISILKEKEWYVVEHNWKKSKKYDKITDLKYLTNDIFCFKAKKKEKVFMVVNFKEWKKYDYIDKVIYSWNGGSYSFIAANIGFKKNTFDYFIIKDWKEIWKDLWTPALVMYPNYPYYKNLKYSKNWKDLYVWLYAGWWYARNWKLIKWYDYIYEFTFFSKKISYFIADKNSKQFIVQEICN